MRILNTPSAAAKMVAVLGVGATCISCAATAGHPAEQFDGLKDDSLVPTATCSILDLEQADTMLLTTGPIGDKDPLPDDIVFTGINGESPAGFSFEAVALTGEGGELVQSVNLGQYDEDNVMEFEMHEFPFSPDGSPTFALGVLVEAPADTEINPEMMFNMTGVEYTTGGKSYDWNITRKSFLSRTTEDPEACARFNDLDADLN